MLGLNYDYETCIRNSERVRWTLDELFPRGTKLDFSRPFLPPSLSGESRLVGLLSADEQLALNHITGHSYLNLFGFVEEFILAKIVEHAQAEMFGDHIAIRALLRFAEEELKHQQLFARYLEAFAAGFKCPCKTLDNAGEVAMVVLGKTPIAVLLLTLHIEIMTQVHYTESVRNDAGLDAKFVSLLEHHWLEESQHARLDALELDKLLDSATPEMIATGFDDYLDLCRAIDGLLAVQTGFDVESLARASGRSFSAAEAEAIRAAQQTAYRNTFLISGMTNRQFISTLEQIPGDGAQRTIELARSFA